MVLVYGRIYLLECLSNGKKYVGQTVQSLRVRFRSHFNSAKHPGKKSFYLHRSLLKYGREGFQISLLCSCQNQAELDLMEDLYIALYDTTNSEKGYNSRRGGGKGKFSEESRKRCSESKTGKKHSAEHRRHIAEGNERSRNTHPPYRHTEEAKRRMSETRSGVGCYKYRIDVSTEDLIRLYETKTTVEIGKIFNIDPSTVGDRLKKAGIPLKTPSYYKGKQSRQLRSDVNTLELVRLYREGKDTKELSNIFPLSPAAIGTRIKSTGEKMRPRGSRKIVVDC